jgi:hypothetical protein
VVALVQWSKVKLIYVKSGAIHHPVHAMSDWHMETHVKRMTHKTIAALEAHITSYYIGTRLAAAIVCVLTIAYHVVDIRLLKYLSSSGVKHHKAVNVNGRAPSIEAVLIPQLLTNVKRYDQMIRRERFHCVISSK